MEKNKVVIGLDLSVASSGIAVYCKDTDPKLFMVLTKPTDFPTSEQRVRHIAKEVHRKLMGELAQRKVSAMSCYWGIEDFAFSNRTGRLAQIAEVAAVVKQIVWELTGRLPVKINPKTLKKFMTGRGDVSKNQHLLYAFTKWNIKFANDDVCDAYAVARAVHATLFEKQNELFKYEQECCKSIIDYNKGCPTFDAQGDENGKRPKSRKVSA